MPCFCSKQVLKGEFGEIKGVARAKRKPYIPVVLSRQEIDLILDHLNEPVDLAAKLLYRSVCRERMPSPADLPVSAGVLP
jgi:hypothetical protein